MEARQLALEAAQQSIVLLKNIDNALALNINRLQNKKLQ
jgi:beta-glucosidase-like glycosyl hydrolase